MFDLNFVTSHFYIYIMKVKVMFVFLVYIFSFLMIDIAKEPLVESEIDQLVEYKVERGDTLWKIGKKLNIENYEKFLYEVKMINKISNSKLNVDDILLIPKNT